MGKVTLVCDCCSHPIINPKNPCPFCGVTNSTEKCGECGTPKLRLPTELNDAGVQYICQVCAFDASAHA